MDTCAQNKRQNEVFDEYIRYQTNEIQLTIWSFVDKKRGDKMLMTLVMLIVMMMIMRWVIRKKKFNIDVRSVVKHKDGLVAYVDIRSLSVFNGRPGRPKHLHFLIFL